MQVGAIEGRLLKLLVASSRARRVVELGTYTGYSSLMIAAGLPADGKLITCDIDPVATAVAQRYFARSPHGSKVQLRLGNALDSLNELERAGETFDLAFIDADKENYVRYWDKLVPMITPGGLLIADNTLWSGHVLDPTEASDRGITAFNTRVAEDTRVEQVILSVRDGITLARKL
jgi:caffeoyl-CoA O-methyltransferase